MKKLVSLVLALILCLSLASFAHAEDDLSEHVVLTMYCIGDEGSIHAQEHLDLLNKLLTEKINAEIQPIMVSWGDYKTKLPMIWASGEAYDLTYTANWAGYYTEGAKGAFKDITDLLPEYAPETWKLMNERGVVDSLKIDDKVYMVCNFIQDYTSFFLEYREDLREKYNCPEIVDDETLEIFLQAIKDNEPGMQPFANNGTEAQAFQNFLNEQDWSRPVDNNNGFMVYNLQNPAAGVFNVTETPEYAAFVEKMRSYYEKGFVSKSIMAQTDAGRNLFKAGKVACCYANFSNANGDYAEILNSNPDWKIGYYSADFKSGHVESIAPANNGVSVGAYSKHPERALRFVELMYTDEEVYSVLMNGIEGVTFEWDPETRTKWIPEGADPTELGLKNLGMQFGYDKFALGSKNDNPVLTEYKAQFAEIKLIPALAGYSIKQDDISGELAAIKTVQDEYKVPLDKGVIDPATGLPQLQQRLEAAGFKTVIDTVNAQIAEYLAK